ncbi:MAG TPA: class I SAM-dependent methyltransferase [Micromonosporaceae bacterium]
MSRLVGYVRAGSTAGRPLLVDVGAGTGISTRALRAAFGPEPEIVGVEPGVAMLAQARAAQGAVEYREGTAESIPVADGAASLVLAAQAVQWFDRPSFYREAVRALRPGGALALLQNDRDWSASAVLAGYEDLLERYGHGYSRHYRAFDFPGELARVDGLGEPDDSGTAWTWTLTRAQFLGLAMSSSKTHAVVRELGAERLTAEVYALLDRHGVGDRVEVPYVTRLFLRRRL